MKENQLQHLLTQLQTSPAPSPSEIQTFESQTNLRIPPAYRQILTRHDGGNATIGNTELTLWSTSYLLQAHSEFEVESALPGALLFASDDKEDAYGFDLRPGSSGAIIKVPMIGMSWAAATVAGDSFEHFLDNLL